MSIAESYHRKNDTLFGFIKKLFGGDQRTLNAKRNIIYSFLFKGVNILINFLIVPLTLGYLDTARYGIWLTLSSLLSWITFFDFGLGLGLRNKLSESLARNESELARVYVSTTYFLMVCTIFIFMILFYLIFPFINWSSVFNAPSSMNMELQRLTGIAIFLFCSQFILSLIGVVFQANQKNALVDFFGLAGGLIAYGFIYLITRFTTGSLLYIGIAFIISPLLVHTASSLYFYSKKYKHLRPSLKYVKLFHYKDLLGLGIQFFVLQIVALLVFSTSNIIIAHFCGPSEVTTYNIAFKYFSIVIICFEIIRAPFWSAFTEAYVKGEMKWISRRIKNLMYINIFMVILSLGMIIIAPYFYNFWVGNSVRVPFQMNILLAIYVIIYNWNNIFVSVIGGLGKIRIHLLQSIVVGFLSVPISIFMVKSFGLSGIVLGMIFCLAPGMIVIPYQYYLIVNGRNRGIWAK